MKAGFTTIHSAGGIEMISIDMKVDAKPSLLLASVNSAAAFEAGPFQTA